MASSSSVRSIAVVHEMIWRPWAGEVESKAVRAEPLDESCQSFLKILERAWRDEKCCIQDHGSASPIWAWGLRNRRLSDPNRRRGKSADDLLDDPLRHDAQLGLLL